MGLNFLVGVVIQKKIRKFRVDSSESKALSIRTLFGGFKNGWPSEFQIVHSLASSVEGYWSPVGPNLIFFK